MRHWGEQRGWPWHLMRPLALPFAGGILSAPVLFSPAQPVRATTATTFRSCFTDRPERSATAFRWDTVLS
jgi:hypothetical protein